MLQSGFVVVVVVVVVVAVDTRDFGEWQASRFAAGQSFGDESRI